MPQDAFDSESSLILHATGKLARKLRVPELVPLASDSRPHLVWYGNVFTAARAQYILTTNAASLYSVLMPGRGITSPCEYLRQFLPKLQEHLQDDGFGHLYERHIAPYAGGIVIAKTASRSVLGSMNDMMRSSKLQFARREISPWTMTKYINETPFGPAPYRFPIDAFPDMTEE
ncbi:MAG: hypothetical protein AMXMBFR82_04790 [Candidatus Hydrogenedentota bacterium]